MAKPTWTNEAEMLGAFLDQAKRAGWEVYPETSGFDALLVATEAVCAPERSPFVVGDQVAVEAKLRPSVKLLAQALPPEVGETYEAADFYVLVVPDRGGVSALREVAARLGIGVAKSNPPPAERWGWGRRDVLFNITFGGVPVGSRDCDRWPRYPRIGPQLWTPGAPVDVPAGVPSPAQVTPWKWAAVRACLELEGLRFTREDFRRRGLSFATFHRAGWVEQTGKAGRRFVYELTGAEDRPDRRWPEVVEALRASGEVCPPEDQGGLFEQDRRSEPAGLQPQRPAQLGLLGGGRG